MFRSQSELRFSTWHGLNLRERSVHIPPEDAADMENMWISDASGSIETRPGFVDDSRVDHDFGAKVTGVHRFYAPAALTADDKQSLAYAFSSGDSADRLFFISGGAWVDTGIGFVGSNRIPVIRTLNLPENKVYVANGVDLLAEWDGVNAKSISIDKLLGGDLGSVVFTGSGLDDMDSSGSHAGFSATTYKIQIDGEDNGITEAAYTGGGLDDMTSSGTFTGGGIEAAVFDGSGLDDMTSGGTYTGTAMKKFRVEIDGTGTPDTFKWSNDNGLTFEATGVSITGAAQTLEDGVTITFAATTGHTLNDKWNFDAVAWRTYMVEIMALGTGTAPDTFRWSDDNGATWDSTWLGITGGAQSLSLGVSITFAAINGHTESDFWDFDAGVDSYKWSDDNGGVFNEETVAMESGSVLLNKGVFIEFDARIGHTSDDIWTFTADAAAEFHPDAIDQVAGHILAWGKESPGFLYYNTNVGDLDSWTRLDFYTSDSSWVTGAIGWEGLPLVWTHNSMYAVEGFPDNIRVSEIAQGYGCLDHRTIVKVGGEIFWAGRGPTGFGAFKWAGGRPVEITKKIHPIFTSIDLANAHKSWAIAYKKYYMVFYPNSADATGQPSRCLAYHSRTGRWYSWTDMNFSSGFWQNFDTDLGQLFLGASAAGTDTDFRIHQFTEGAFANPFDTNGIESTWQSGDLDAGNYNPPKQWQYFQFKFKILGSGSFNVGTIQAIVDDVAGAALSVDETKPTDQVVAIKDSSGDRFPSGHMMRYKIRTRGTKGIRYDRLSIGFQPYEVQRVAD